MVSFIPEESMCCLSTDTKPAEGIENGQLIIEMDTNKTFMFSVDNKKWYPIGA